jgi:predicted small lipoprotein YifL
MKKLVLLALIASLAACGVKSNLVRPNGQPTADTERDPSRPPNQTGR